MAWSSKVHFKDADGFVVDPGGYIEKPVLGTTAFAATDVVTGTTFPNDGAVVLTQNQTTTPRTFTVLAPVKGCKLDIVIASTASTDCQIDINLGTGVGVLYAGTTSMSWIIASTDKSPSTYRSISLVGLSTSLWGVTAHIPSTTGWLFAASSS